jgi:SAM-dependent methyltransferase
MSREHASHSSDGIRLREFWDRRYSQFTLSESGWLGAGEALNDRIYACKRQALRRSIAALGLARDGRWSVLDAGCGQGHFARFYRAEYPLASYLGLDISARAVSHLQQTVPGAAFEVADLCDLDAADGRTFDLVQSLEVLHLILDDDAMRRALANLARRLNPRGTLLVTAAMPETTIQASDYLRFRSREFWERAIASLGLRVIAERPMYYWLPAGGPANVYARYALGKLGVGALYALDRAALAAGLPRPASAAIDSRMRLLSVRRA